MMALATACTGGGTAPTFLAMVPTEPTAEPTPIATTAPVELPTATPVPTPIPIPTVVPPTATSVPPTSVPVATEPTVAPTAIPATAVPATVEPTSTPEPDPTPQEATPQEATPPAVDAGGPPAEHVVSEYGYVTLGRAGEVWLTIPSARVELIGFHQASHPGAQEINAAGTGLEMMVLDSRGRGTPARSAADIVVPPGEPLRSPVTGTVVSATTYVLYCEHQDKLVYIEPDGLPGWQVRLFHVQGDTPAVGTRVIAGETVVATGGANLLPFDSQVDEFTAEPSWAHVHVEVVNTNIPDDRPPGGGC